MKQHISILKATCMLGAFLISNDANAAGVPHPAIPPAVPAPVPATPPAGAPPAG